MSPRSRANILVGFLCILTWFLSSIQANLNHSIPRGTLRKRHVPSNARVSGGGGGWRHTKPFVPTYDWEQQEYVMTHNDLRGTLGMPPLQWDPNLTSYAHSWASRRRADCNHRKHSPGPFGENTFWMQYKEFTPADVVKKWFEEQALFDHGTNLCKCQPERSGCECGHYTNVIWKTTQRVGCSSPVYCAKGRGLIVVCSYDPPGSLLAANPLDP